MAISRERKEELVALYTQILQGTDGFIVTENRGMTVPMMNDLRRRLSASGGTYSITKNTLFTIALRETGWVIPEEHLSGTNGVVFGNGNLPAVAKVLQGYVKDNPDRFSIKGGVVATSIFGAKEIETIANLPTLDEIRAQLVGLIVQPATSLATLLEQATAQVVNVVAAYADKDKNEAA